MDIGCRECGELSSVVGVFNTEQEAEEANKNHLLPDTTWGRPEWGGEHSLEVFEIEIPNL